MAQLIFGTKQQIQFASDSDFLKHSVFYRKTMEQLQYIGNITRTKELGVAKGEFIVIKILRVFQHTLVMLLQQV